MKNVGIFNCHLEYFKSICYILCPFGSLVVVWHTHFPRFGIVCQEKSGNPDQGKKFLTNIKQPD
jgi:hypothetical protein